MYTYTYIVAYYMNYIYIYIFSIANESLGPV